MKGKFCIIMQNYSFDFTRFFFCMDFFKFSDLLCDSYPYRITTWWLNLLYRQFEKWVVTVDGDWWENWRQNCWKIFICLHFHPRKSVWFLTEISECIVFCKSVKKFNDVDVLFALKYSFEFPLSKTVKKIPYFAQ